MNQLLQKWPKALLVGLGAVMLSTLGIQASDMLSGVTSQLASSVSSEETLCGSGATLILYGSHSVCMDVYEASANAACTYSAPASEVETRVNVAKDSCGVDSVPDVGPWRFVTYAEASQLCARGGKRLPSAEEWYKVALGQTSIESCFTASLANTGVNNCVTPTGVHDLLGNVWEWSGDTITNGMFNDISLPDSGYVALIDGAGVVLETRDTPSLQFGEDYAWVSKSDVRGLLRGGFYGSGEDGGLFTQNLAIPLDFVATGVGFRCVRDVR